MNDIISRENEYISNTTLRDLVYTNGDDCRILGQMCHNCYYSIYGSCTGANEGYCQVYEFYYDYNQAYAEYLIREKLNGNTYLFARVFGMDLESHLKELKNTLSIKKDKKQVDYYNDIISEIEKVINISDYEIESLKTKCNTTVGGKELNEIIINFTRKNMGNYRSVYNMANDIDRDVHRNCDEYISFTSITNEDISKLEIPKRFKLKGIKPCHYDKEHNMIVTGIRQTEIYGKKSSVGNFALDHIGDIRYLIYPNVDLKKEVYKWAKDNNLKVTTDHEEYGLNKIPF